MNNLGLLKRKIEYDGIKLVVISYRMGLSRTTLWHRLSGKSEFTSDEVRDICRILKLDEKERKAIFGYDPIGNDIFRRH